MEGGKKWHLDERLHTLYSFAWRMMTLMSMEYGGLDSVIREHSLLFGPPSESPSKKVIKAALALARVVM